MIKKLVKTESTYHLVVNNKIIASVGDSDGKLQKLSLKNCEVVRSGYDLDELYLLMVSSIGYEELDYNSFEIGFLNALNFFSDKKFSEDDMRKMYDISCGKIGLSLAHDQTENNERFRSHLRSIKQTEWDVEIITEPFLSVGDNFHDKYQTRPKLDADGCLILKRK